MNQENYSNAIHLEENRDGRFDNNNDRNKQNEHPVKRKVDVLLYEFLLRLLDDPSKCELIRWIGNDGEFVLLEPEEVAAQWGVIKEKTDMNYDKLSRSLRYYYSKNILRKIEGVTHAYKFNMDFLRTDQMNKKRIEAHFEREFDKFRQRLSYSAEFERTSSIVFEDGNNWSHSALSDNRKKYDHDF